MHGGVSDKWWDFHNSDGIKIIVGLYSFIFQWCGSLGVSMLWFHPCCMLEVWTDRAKRHWKCYHCDRREDGKDGRNRGLWASSVMRSHLWYSLQCREKLGPAAGIFHPPRPRETFSIFHSMFPSLPSAIGLSDLKRWLKPQTSVFSQCRRLEVQNQGASRAGFWWEVPLWLADGTLLLHLHMAFLLCAPLFKTPALTD